MGILQHLPCGICIAALVAVYADQIAREWREFHPQPATEPIPASQPILLLSA